MIKDVMVRLDGGSSDATRLAAANEIAEIFDGSVIGLYINILPFLVPEEGGAINSIELLNEARGIGDRIEADLNERLSRLRKPWELRRYDLFSDTMAEVAAREARAADTFVALRPNGVPVEDEGVSSGPVDVVQKDGLEAACIQEAAGYKPAGTGVTTRSGRSLASAYDGMCLSTP